MKTLNPSKCYNLALSIFRFVLAGCFSQWYWTQSKEYKYLQENPLSLSFGFVLKNFGTLASGSIFMTVLVVSQARAQRTSGFKIRLGWSGWTVRWALDKAFMAFWKVKYEFDITAAELGAIMAFGMVFVCLQRKGLDSFSKIWKSFPNHWKICPKPNKVFWNIGRQIHIFYVPCMVRIYSTLSVKAGITEPSVRPTFCDTFLMILVS